MTNRIYRQHNIYKIGYTNNICERNKIQMNSSPYPFYYEVLVFSNEYKIFENEVKKELDKYNITKLNGEWIECDNKVLIDIVFNVALKTPNNGINVNGAFYKYNPKTSIFEKRNKPHICFKHLDIKEGTKLKCIADDKVFKTIGNKSSILVDGKEMTMSSYMNEFHPRKSKTNEHRGAQYFKKVGNNKALLSEIWDDLFLTE